MNLTKNCSKVFPVILLIFATPVSGKDVAPNDAKQPAGAKATKDSGKSKTPNVEKLVRLSETEEVWIDQKNKRVIIGGRICLNKGVLEMFACPKQSKEHESVVAVNAQAKLVHTALLAVGAKVGKPVSYDPKYVPASGQKIKVEVAWKGKDGKLKKRRAQEMIQHARTKKPMKHDWVFAGSGFWTDKATGERFYLADGGELICVSNFSSAMMDLPIKSTQNEAQLLFEARTEQIPDVDTKVKLLLTPIVEKKKP